MPVQAFGAVSPVWSVHLDVNLVVHPIVVIIVVIIVPQRKLIHPHVLASMTASTSPSSNLDLALSRAIIIEQGLNPTDDGPSNAVQPRRVARVRPSLVTVRVARQTQAIRQQPPARIGLTTSSSSSSERLAKRVIGHAFVLGSGEVQEIDAHRDDVQAAQEREGLGAAGRVKAVEEDHRGE
jgi:hypothetical protein